MIEIRSNTYPTLYDCLDVISHDNGMGAGHPFYGVNDIWAPCLYGIEEALSALRPGERETLCTGEMTACISVARRSPELERAHTIFGECFTAEAA